MEPSTSSRPAPLAASESSPPSSRFDPDRFRPNVVIDTSDEGFLETTWQGKTLAIGDARLAVTMTVPRCVMTTLAQGDLPADRDVLRTIARHNSVLLGGVHYPCVGVYADVVAEGDIRAGRPGDGGLIDDARTAHTALAAYACANPTQAVPHL